MSIGLQAFFVIFLSFFKMFTFGAVPCRSVGGNGMVRPAEVTPPLVRFYLILPHGRGNYNVSAKVPCCLAGFGRIPYNKYWM